MLGHLIFPVALKFLKKEQCDMSTFSSESIGDVEQLPGALESDVFVFPTSFAQQRLWFFAQLQPASPFYHIPTALRLSGPLDLAALHHSFHTILQRQESLRTSFSTLNGEPVQLIVPSLSLTIPLIDLQALSASSQDAEAHRLAQQEATRLFDLSRAPLLRVTLLRCSPQEHVFLLTMHHIISDGWSLHVLVHELLSLYQAFCLGRPSPLPPLPIQYADYTMWQLQHLQGAILQQHLDYWTSHLAQAPALLPLPTDHPRPAIQTFRGACLSFSLSPELTSALHILSKQEGVTLFMTLLSAFQVLLARSSGLDDIMVASPIANRTRPELKGLIGFFVNTLVLRSDLSGDPSFLLLLQRVRETALQAYAHQDLPFEKLVEELHPVRDLSFNPLAQVLFTLQTTPQGSLPPSSLQISPLYTENLAVKFDLELSLSEEAGRLSGTLGYNTDLFEAQTIERLAGHYRTLLEAIVDDPLQRVSMIPLLTKAECHQLLIEWNASGGYYPQALCIHQIFEKQAARTPEAIALVGEYQQLTYWELNQRANQLARHLQMSGVGPEVVVGISLERSPEMVISLLAILKAGGAYVPLDPAYPAQRLDFMLRDSHAEIVLTQGRLQARFAEYHTRLVCLDREQKRIAQLSSTNVQSGVRAENLAYVIYTSGSTGQPKGVTIEHRGLCNIAQAQASIFQVRPENRVLQFASLNFDAAIFEMLMALLAGAALHVVPFDLLQDGPALSQLVSQQAITTITLTPSVLRILSPGEFPGLQTIISAGEKCGSDIIAQWAPNRQLFNAYGPTESTIWASVIECASENNGSIIGRPIINTQFYVVDPHWQPVPIGIPGELLISGVGLARGYLDRPELTAERFCPNPFSQEPNARLYKTGDLVRYLPDGNLEFLGRLDNQVKIRGFRIELGEIEAILSQHPAVQEAAVVAQEDSAGNTRLVAYLVTDQQFDPSQRELRSYLRERLPEYMLPAFFVFLDTLPLTLNGKLDHHMLPEPEKPVLENAFALPRNPIEQALSKIWAEVLGIEHISIDDDFFELGGHSLLALRLVARIQTTLGQHLPLLAIFQGRTIETLARILDEPQKNFSQFPLITLQAGDSRTPFFCVHPAGGNTMCYVGLARALGSNQPFYALQAPGLDGTQEAYTKIEEMATHYIEAVQTIQPQGPYLLGGWSLGGTVAFEMARQLQEAGHQVALLALLDSWAPIPYNKAEGSDAQILFSFVKDIAGSTEREIPVPDDTFQHLDISEQLQHILEWSRRVNALTPEIDLPQIHQLFHIFQTNTHAWLNYIPQVYKGQITLLRSTEEVLEGIQDTTRGWGDLTTEEVDVREFTGNHYAIVTHPEVLAAKLKVCLDMVYHLT